MSEKPLAVTRADGARVMKAARKSGKRVGGAPDTFLGAGIQTCRKLIDDGAIGTPVAANAFMLCHGHESWHPDPEFYEVIPLTTRPDISMVAEMILHHAGKYPYPRSGLAGMGRSLHSRS